MTAEQAPAADLVLIVLDAHGDPHLVLEVEGAPAGGRPAPGEAD